MTQKEIANRLRALIPQIDVSTHGDVAGGDRVYTDSVVSASEVRELADELDPPMPENGTLVWWRATYHPEWTLGFVGNYAVIYWNDKLQDVEEIGITGISVDGFELKKAQVLKPGQIAVEAIR